MHDEVYWKAKREREAYNAAMAALNARFREKFPEQVQLAIMTRDARCAANCWHGARPGTRPSRATERRWARRDAAQRAAR